MNGSTGDVKGLLRYFHFIFNFEFNFFFMLTTIKGTYNNGQIVLDEAPPTETESKVMVTFLEEFQTPQKRRLGSLKGKIGIPDNFNEPLDDLKDYM